MILVKITVNLLSRNDAQRCPQNVSERLIALNFSFDDLPTSLLEQTDYLIGFYVLDLELNRIS